MKNLVKGLTALLICGSFIVCTGGNAEAAETAELTATSAETQEFARHHGPLPPPPPPPHGRPGHHPPPPVFGDWRDPPHHGDRHRHDRHRHRDRHRHGPHHRW